MDQAAYECGEADRELKEGRGYGDIIMKGTEPFFYGFSSLTRKLFGSVSC
jgi:hypothetical protein